MFLRRWVTPYRGRLGAGLVCWALCSAAAVVYAAQTGGAALPTIVTWNEWLVAILLIPTLFTVGATGVRAATRGSRMRVGLENVLAGGRTGALGELVQEDVERDARSGRGAILAWVRWVAATIFGLDLLVRGLLGLGWEPFF